MSEYDLDSLIVACDFRVADVEKMWRWMQRQSDGLADFGAHHVVVYSSIWEPDRILVTIGIRQPHSIRELLGSPRLFEWFDIAGVQDIPPIFGGEVVERVDLYDPTPIGAIANVIVGAMAEVDDVSNLMVKVRDALDRFRAAGVRRLWVYRALDNGHEVMILQEIESEAAARQWIDHPDAAAEWMTKVGLGAYPSLFVGKFVHLMSVDESRYRMR
ncbi:fatty-acid--CoA ligase [Mycolicibacterium thermoresistibile]